MCVLEKWSFYFLEKCLITVYVWLCEHIATAFLQNRPSLKVEVANLFFLWDKYCCSWRQEQDFSSVSYGFFAFLFDSVLFLEA